MPPAILPRQFTRDELDLEQLVGSPRAVGATKWLRTPLTTCRMEECQNKTYQIKKKKSSLLWVFVNKHTTSAV